MFSKKIMVKFRRVFNNGKSVSTVYLENEMKSICSKYQLDIKELSIDDKEGYICTLKAKFKEGTGKSEANILTESIKKEIESIGVEIL